jgi:predicted dehydrogenase
MINVGVIGAGYWGPNLVRNFVKNQNTKISLVCDINTSRLDTVRFNYPFISTVKDYREITNSKDIDLVTICTPVCTHYDIAKAALISGKNVLLTKPMTSTSHEAEDLLNLAEQKRVRIFVDHTFVFTGAVRKIKELIDSNQVGKLFYYDSVRVNLGLLQHDVNVIWDLAPHDISIMNYFIGLQPQCVIATGADHFGQGFEDVAYLTIYFSDNLIAHVHVNWLSPVKIRQCLLAGDKKMIVWDDNQPSEKVRIYDKGVDVVESKDQIYNILIQYRTGDMYCPKVDTKEALEVEIDHIAESLESNVPPLSDGYQGLAVVKLLEAAQESIKTRGKEVKV